MDWYIGNEWKSERRGLRKEVLDLQFSELEKPHSVSKVLIKVEEVTNLEERPSKYLTPEKLTQEQELEMGTALTAVDYYLEMLLSQMIVGERSRCYIKTSKNTEITFVLVLQRILTTQEIHMLKVKEMYDLAKRYKENGVAMFKNYPKFAHDYFARAAKCLISYKPFDNLSERQDGVAGSDMQSLLNQIHTNLAACLLTQKRYNDVIYLTEFMESLAEPPEKGIYRRAMAYYNMQDYEKAKTTIERISNYQEKREFVHLYQRIAESWKSSNEQYKTLVQRMFS